MAFAITRADHVGFSVASLEAAIAFWTDCLGARLVRRAEMGGQFLEEVTGVRRASVVTAVVELAGQSIELLEYRGTPRPKTRSEPFDPGFAHLALVVDDIDAVLRSIAEHGWRAKGVPQPIAAGPRVGTLVVYASGPDGETIEFMQPPQQ